MISHTILVTEGSFSEGLDDMIFTTHTITGAMAIGFISGIGCAAQIVCLTNIVAKKAKR
eukprot:m.112433 g.112433  ORF g.112433 m.112433 type:complete len:59 (-) comp28193_c0_seq5:43-219(-)